jgi:hypothetical protein
LCYGTVLQSAEFEVPDELEVSVPESAPHEKMIDTVAVDAKRILLRYGTPIAILDRVSEVDRIALARQVSRTRLPDREPRLKALLAEHGYLQVD